MPHLPDNLEQLRRAVLDIALKLGEGHARGGKPYDWMLDCRELLLGGDYLQQAAGLLWERIKPFRPDFVGGMTLAANPLTIAVMYESRRDNQPVNAFLIRREPKADGLGKTVEGPPIPPGARVVLLDDVVNSGATQAQALAALEPFGARIVAVAALVDYERAGARLLAARQIPLISLFTLRGLGVAPNPPARPGMLSCAWKAGPLNDNRDGVPHSAPCVRGGMIFIGSNAGFLAAVGLDGQVKWRHPVRDHARGVHSSPAVFRGKVYFGAYDGYFYCLDAESGTPVWESRLGQWIGSSPVILPEAGLVAVGAESGEAGGQVFALHADSGETAWSFKAAGYIHGSPLFDAARGQVIIGANDMTAYALDLGGRERLRFVTGGPLKARATVDDEGRCFIASFDGHLYALDAATGRLLWRRRAGRSLYFTPHVWQDLVVVGSQSSRLVAYCRRTGAVRWVVTTGGRIFGGVAQVGPDHLAFGAADGVIYVVEARGGTLADCYRTGDEIMTTPAFAAGKLLVPSLDGQLYGLDVDLTAPAEHRTAKTPTDGTREPLEAQSNFRRVRAEIDVRPLLAEVDAIEARWADNTTRAKIPVQRQTETIILRGADMKRHPGMNVNDVQESQPTPAAAACPAIMHFLTEFARDQGATLERAMLVRLRPQGQVFAHIDEGRYYAPRERYHLVLASPEGSSMTSGDESVLMREGELWWFNNKLTHEARNPAGTWRLHVIFDLLPLSQTGGRPD